MSWFPPPNRRFDRSLMEVGMEKDARFVAAADRHKARRRERGSLTHRVWVRIRRVLSTEDPPASGG